jgi:hypothetical protein
VGFFKGLFAAFENGGKGIEAQQVEDCIFKNEFTINTVDIKSTIFEGRF